MNRTTAIIVTAVSVLLCGCPGLALAALGIMAAFGSQMPEVMAQNAGTPEEALLGAGMFLCFGVVLILIPVIVGVLSLRNARSDDSGFSNTGQSAGNRTFSSCRNMYLVVYSHELAQRRLDNG